MPESVQRMYQNAERYYQVTSKLDMMAAQYNRIRSTIRPVEQALLLHRLTDIDTQLEKVRRSPSLVCVCCCLTLVGYCRV